MLPCVCSVTEHRRRQNVIKTKVAREAIDKYVTDAPTIFDVICDQFLKRRTATWNLFVLYNKETKNFNDVIYALVL